MKDKPTNQGKPRHPNVGIGRRALLDRLTGRLRHVSKSYRHVPSIVPGQFDIIALAAGGTFMSPTSIYAIELHERTGVTLLETFTGRRRQARAVVQRYRKQRRADKKTGAVHERWVSGE